MTDASAQLRSELLAALAENTDEMVLAIEDELARGIALEPARRWQFEADPWTWGIHSCATEDPLGSPSWLEDSLPAHWYERCEEASLNWDSLLLEEICPWFARCWEQARGPERYRPAFLFLHGYHDRQYDLEHRRWIPAAEAFGL